MKKVIVGIIALVGVVSSLVAMPNGKYLCVPASIADEHWNPVAPVEDVIPGYQAKEYIVGITLKDETAVSDDEKYVRYIKTNEVSIYHIINGKNDTEKASILVPNSNDPVKDGLYVLGLSLKAGKILYACKKIEDKDNK